MPNAIKYNVSAETLALKKGNFWIGTGDVGKGPTSSTGYYNGITPPSGGYTIYLNKETGGPSIYTVTTEAQMVSLTNTIGAQSFTTSGQCLNWFATQTDKMIFNIDYPAVVTNGLVLNMDAAFVPSYSTSGTSWYSIGVSGNTGSLVNGPTYSDGSIVFDGTNDGVSITPTPTITSAFTFNMWVNKTQSKDSAAIIAIQGTLWQIDNNTIYWWSNVNFGPMSHSFTSTLNQWYNFCITQDNQTAKLYINSTLVRTTTMTDVNTTRGNNTIGCWGIGDRPWLGKISLTQIYNRVLTDSEIAQNYEAIGTRYTSLSVQSLVVAGGGGGGSNKGGGGGAGGLLTGTTTNLTTNTNYTITIGGGGAVDTNGSNSVFNLTTSNGGGAGGRIFNTTAGTGGCGGGAGGAHAGIGTGYSGGTPFSGQGYKGGGNYNGVTVLTHSGGGGGGGAGMAGYNALETSGATGGDGLYFSEYSTLGGSPSGWFAGGAGGGAPYNNDRGFGGKGGGGQGAQNLSGYGTQNASGGTVNTGGGGGGGSIGGSGSGFYDGKSGGSGIVILRIPDVYTARFSSGVSASVTKSGGYKYYKVTATSTTSETVSFS
jgi:hypothetical protein